MVGSSVGHYKVLEKLGEGGMGVVYKAEDTRLDRTVALKFLAPHLLANEEAKKRFVREAKAAAALDHPNICTLYEIDDEEGRTFMSMAYLDGQTLEDKIARGPLPLDQAVEIAKQIAKGLQEAHEKGIAHRDIKPSNVILLETSSKEMLVKIMDFGLAHLAGQTKLTQVDTTLGTVAYMSPEQTQAESGDHRSDIWALGVVLYEMVSGRRPFLGEYDRAVMYSIVSEDPEPLTALRTGAPMELEWVVGKALAKTPERRYQSGVELVVDLESLAAKVGGEGSRVAGSSEQASRPAATAPLSALSDVGGPTLRKRQIRELVLDLANQGVLPDRLVSQALETISAGPDDETEAEQTRNELLDNLLYKRLSVGEFIEQWHGLDSGMGIAPAESPAKAKTKTKKKRESCDERSDAEVFGIPIFHRAWGKDPSTGKERVATGVVAIGNVAIGVVSVAKWVAVGGVTVSPISIGFAALGVVAVGFNAVAPLGLNLSGMPWWQSLPIVIVLAGLAGGLYYRYTVKNRPDPDPDP